MNQNIPWEPLDVRFNSSGLPLVGIHQRNQLYIQESSYSHFAFLGVMCLVALIILFIPWETKTGYGIKLKYLIAAIPLWGGICVAFAFFVRNLLGQTILIDPWNKTLEIKRWDKSRLIEWKRIIGVQLCLQPAPKNDELGDGYQLNLVWQNNSNAIERHCLVKHTSRKYVVKMGSKYESIFGIRMLSKN